MTHLDPDLNAIDQVRYAGELLGMNPAAAMQRAHEVLEYVGLRETKDIGRLNHSVLEMKTSDKTGLRNCS